MDLPRSLPYSQPQKKHKLLTPQAVGIGLIGLALGGITPPLMPAIALESSYYISQLKHTERKALTNEKPLPASAPVLTNYLLSPDGSTLVPKSLDFGIIVPKIGVNASVIPGVNPMKEEEYEEALHKGVAHASTSYFPNEDGVVYLFSHSTNYEWFTKELNAIFYLLKNLEAGDTIILSYKQELYIYRLAEKRIVSPSDTSYIQPIKGERKVILQTCWPPGSTTERLLLIAELIDRQSYHK